MHRISTFREKYSGLLQSMVCNLSIDKENPSLSINLVTQELFEGKKNVVTWHRIIALYCFGGELVRHYQVRLSEQLDCKLYKISN